MCAETNISTISVWKSRDPWIPVTDKDPFRPCSCSADTIDLSTNDIEDPVSHIASTLRLWFPFNSLIRTSRSHPCVIIVATAVVASEAHVVASSFKSLCKSLLCRCPRLGALQVLLLQSFDRWAGRRQLKTHLNFCTCSRRSFSFIVLKFLQLQIACCPSLNGRFKFFSLVESSAFDAKIKVFGVSRFCNLEFVWANKSACMKTVFWANKTSCMKGLLLVVEDPVGVVASALSAEWKVIWLLN